MSKERFRRLLPPVTTFVLILPLVFVLAAPVSAAGTIRVDKDVGGCVSPPQGDPYSVVYCAINGALSDASPGDTIHVYPGTYYESVDLTNMNPPLDITLVTVNDTGTPTPGTVTVDATGLTGYGISSLVVSNTGNVIIDGFNVLAAGTYPAVSIYLNGNITIRNVTAQATGSSGAGIRATPAGGGTVTITNCVSNNNPGDGIWVQGWDFSGQDVNITNCTANNNGQTGIEVGSLDGNVYMANCTANLNGGGGIRVSNSDYDTRHGDVVIQNCTANSNPGMLSNGIRVANGSGASAITDCVARDNGQGGVALSSLTGTASRRVNGSIICGNIRYGLFLTSDVSPDATGDWWGCPDGPGGTGCDTIGGAYAANVSYDPWIDTVSASVTVDPATVGEPTVVSFQLSDTSVYLGEGPGDLNGVLPFTVSTDNGILNGIGPTIQTGINNPNGVLSVTLVPDTSGTATVTLDGPCGIGALDGTTIDVDVLEPPPEAEEEEFVPEMGSVVLLASGLMGLAGYAGLRLRRK